MNLRSSRNTNNVMYSPSCARGGRLLIPTCTSWGNASMTALFFNQHFQLFSSVFFLSTLQQRQMCFIHAKDTASWTAYVRGRALGLRRMWAAPEPMNPHHQWKDAGSQISGDRSWSILGTRPVSSALFLSEVEDDKKKKFRWIGTREEE